MQLFTLPVGANITPKHKVRLKVWAPNARNVSVVSDLKTVEMKREEHEFFATEIRMPSDPRYLYRIDNSIELPDPASRFQPDGIRGPSQIIDPEDFTWTDQDWHGISLEDLIIYELPVSTFTREGNF